MASINFFADQTLLIQNLSGSGLGFFGSTFGNSVEVGAYQDSTYITDGNGINEGPQCNNVKWTHPGSGSVNGTASDDLQDIPNRLASLRVEFSHTSAVKTQNPALRIYDRSSINNPASGVTTKVAELIHPDPTQGASNQGSGDATWQTPTGSSVIMTGLLASPGKSGQSPNGPGTTETQHDWFFAISASPDSIGSKTLYGLYFETEYL